VVVHWGDERDTLAALRSIAASTVAAVPFVVDNGTGRLTHAAVEAAAPDAELIVLPENRGFTGGSNAAIRRALAAGSDYVLLLNNDATLEPGSLGELVAVANSAERIAAVGAKILYAADPTRIWAAWGRITYRAALVELVGQGEPDGPRFGEPREVEWVSGCAMLLTRPALEAVGLLDERFFAYHEDVDWCTTARARGFRILFAPTARVHHRGEGSLSPRGVVNAARYLSARNTVLFARKHARPTQCLRLVLTIGGSVSLAYLRSRGDEQARVRSLLVRGYIDGLLGRDVPYAALGLR
jgi:GT2 family glycosyltransferase